LLVISRILFASFFLLSLGAFERSSTSESLPGESEDESKNAIESDDELSVDSDEAICSSFSFCFLNLSPRSITSFPFLPNLKIPIFNQRVCYF